jgi:hypothetical protein
MRKYPTLLVLVLLTLLATAIAKIGKSKVAGDTCGKCLKNSNIFCIKGGLYQSFDLESDLEGITYCCDSFLKCPYLKNK